MTVCDKPMLGGENNVPIPGSGTPDSDGARKVPLDPTGTTEVTFYTPNQLTQVKVSPPDDSEPGDKVTVTVEYTTDDNSKITKVCVRYLKTKLSDFVLLLPLVHT